MKFGPKHVCENGGATAGLGKLSPDSAFVGIPSTPFISTFLTLDLIYLTNPKWQAMATSTEGAEPAALSSPPFITVAGIPNFRGRYEGWGRNPFARLYSFIIIREGSPVLSDYLCKY